MKYLSEDDLTTDSYQRFIIESSADNPDVIFKCEDRAIALVITYLSSRYSVKDIFGDDELNIPPLRNELLADIITKITLYKLFKRNAARKLPDDIKEGWDWSILMLEKLQTGRIILNLPPALDENGQVKSKSIWGNLSNKNYYI